MEETGESANALVFGRVRSTQARGESGVTCRRISHASKKNLFLFNINQLFVLPS